MRSLQNSAYCSCLMHFKAVSYGAQVGFKMFLNTTATVVNWNADNTQCSLVRLCKFAFIYTELPPCFWL